MPLCTIPEYGLPEGIYLESYDVNLDHQDLYSIGHSQPIPQPVTSGTINMSFKMVNGKGLDQRPEKLVQKIFGNKRIVEEILEIVKPGQENKGLFSDFPEVVEVAKALIARS